MLVTTGELVLGAAVTWRAGSWIRRTTTGCMVLLALIAGTVSYLHMHRRVARHGQPGWVAALTPLSVDGMIVAASTTLLADSTIRPQRWDAPVGTAGRGHSSAIQTARKRPPDIQRG